MALQQVLVGIIVAAAVVFALWRLPGRATRLRYVGWMKRLAGGHALLAPLARLAWRIESRLRREESACSGCSAGDPPPASRPAAHRDR